MSEIAPDSPIRVFLVFENRLLREALDRLFRKRSDFIVVGCGGQEAASFRMLGEIPCDVLALDFFDPRWLPTFSERHALQDSKPRFLLIGMSSEFEQFLAAVRAGVTGYLLKLASTSDVVSAVRATARGEAVCPPKLCLSLFQHVAQLPREATALTGQPRPDLTLRQQQLVALVAKGLTNKEIADRLNISGYTVRNHIHRILKQVDAESRSEAVETIRAHGYVLNT